MSLFVRKALVVGVLVFAVAAIAAPVQAVTIDELMAQIAALQSQSSSDSVSAIENDLNATDLEDLDHEMQVIEQELGF